jgi:hypothetical protein
MGAPGAVGRGTGAPKGIAFGRGVVPGGGCEGAFQFLGGGK